MLNLSTVNIRISKGICNYLMPPMFYSAIRTRQMLDKIPNEKSRLIFSRLPKCRAVSSPRCPRRRLLHSSPRLTPWWPTATGCCGMVAEPSRDLLMWWTSSGKWGRGSFSAPTIALSKLRFYYVQVFFNFTNYLFQDKERVCWKMPGSGIWWNQKGTNWKNLTIRLMFNSMFI